MKKGQRTVNVNILGRNYPVKCSGSEVDELKRAERVLNTQLKQYMLTYDQIDKQDCLSMALIENQLSPDNSAIFETESICMDKLNRLENLLDESLNS